MAYLFLVRLRAILQPYNKNSNFNMKLSKYSTFIGTVAILAVAIVHIRAQSSPNPSATVSARNMIHHAKGTFEVTLKPLALENAGGGEKLARMSSDKKFDGDLVGTGKGEMLSAGTEVKGSAGYVALERVVGTLDGRKGSFVFQHSGTMNRGVPLLTIVVVPDSGTEGLTGIMGTLQIEIKDNKHFYDFQYTLPP